MGGGEVEGRILALARRQFQLVTREQCVAAGLSRYAVISRVRRRVWTELIRGVYAIAVLNTSEQRDMGALLHAGEGAALSRLSAAFRLGFDVPRPRWPQVTIPAERRVRSFPGVDLQRARDLCLEDLTVRGPFQLTRAGRTLVDLAGVLERPAMRAALDSSLRLNPENLAWAWKALQKRARGHVGAGLLRGLLEEYSKDSTVPDSVLESLAMEFCLVAGRKPWLHYPVCDGEQFVAEVDLAWPEVKMAVELDGYRFHCARSAFASDRTRDRRLAALGWTVHRFVYRDLAARPDCCVRELTRLYELCLSRARNHAA
jgi:hypothetical protein